MIPLPPGVDGLSPPPYCKCHRFIFYPYITDSLVYCRVATKSPSAIFSEASSSSLSDYEQHLEGTFKVSTNDNTPKRKCSSFRIIFITQDSLRPKELSVRT